MWRQTQSIVSALMVLGCAAVAAAGDVVVDGKVISDGGGFQFPDGSVQTSAASPKWQQVAFVDVNGRGDYLDPVAAMTDLATWCPAPSAAAPCLVKILPGTYGIGAATLTMQPHVEIEGSGRRITVIATSAATAVAAADQSALRSLTVFNDASFAKTIGVSISNADFRLVDVHVEVVSSGFETVGVSTSDSIVTAQMLEITVTGADFATGLETSNGCAGELRDVDVNVETTVPGYSGAVGIKSTGTSAPRVVESEISIVAADDGQGIITYGPGLQIEDVRVAIAVVGRADGLVNWGSGTVQMDGGSIRTDAAGFTTAIEAIDGVTIVRDAHLYAKSSGDWGYGVTLGGTAEVVLERDTITAEGDTIATGVNVTYGSTAVATLTEVIARAFGGSTYNYGLFSSGTVPFTVARCTLMAAGGGGSWGVLNAGSGGAGGTIDHSTLTGETKAVRNDNASAGLFVGDSKLDGGVTANLTCFGNYDDTYTAVTCP